MIIIATIIKPFSFRSARVPVNTAFEYVFIHAFMPQSTHASLFLFLFSRASSVTGSNPRSHHVFVRSATFAFFELFSFGQDPVFMARAWLMSSNQQPFRHSPTMTLYEAGILNHDLVGHAQPTDDFGCGVHSRFLGLNYRTLRLVQQFFSILHMQLLFCLGEFRLWRSMMTIHFLFNHQT
jgi:hypothetical protein